jgi:hypothetical protein
VGLPLPAPAGADLDGCPVSGRSESARDRPPPRQNLPWADSDGLSSTDAIRLPRLFPAAAVPDHRPPLAAIDASRPWPDYRRSRRRRKLDLTRISSPAGLTGNRSCTLHRPAPHVIVGASAVRLGSCRPQAVSTVSAHRGPVPSRSWNRTDFSHHPNRRPYRGSQCRNSHGIRQS